jgi:hypothetical protein
MPVFSSAYREIPVQRFVMMTMGGFWPVIQKLPDGRLGVVTRDGDAHLGERGRLVFVNSADGGESWSRAALISADGPDNRNPAFGVCQDGDLLAAFVKADLYVDGDYTSSEKGDPNIYISRSADGGETWSRGTPIDSGGSEITRAGGSPFGKMVTLEDGTMLLAFYSSGGVWLLKSGDNGKTWTDPVRIAEGMGECALCDLGGGRLMAVMRSGTLLQSDSTDGGLSWSSPRRITGEKEYPGDVLRLKDGRLLLTYGRRLPPYGVQGMISDDGGKTWDRDRRLLLVGDSRASDCGYPSSIQREDGLIVTVYYAWDVLSDVEVYNRLGVHGAALLYRPEDLP